MTDHDPGKQLIAHISHDWNPKLAICGEINRPPRPNPGEKVLFCPDCSAIFQKGTKAGD